jgi:hypothetical protein
MTHSLDNPIVSEGIRKLKLFSKERDLGPPVSVMRCDPHPKWDGIACEWDKNTRTAIAVGKSYLQEADEIERLAREWAQERQLASTS